MTVLDTMGEVTERALDTVVGAGEMAADVIAHPGDTVERARRRGAGAAERVEQDVAEVVDEVLGLPEQVVTASVRMLRGQAKREDAVGSVARTILQTVHTRSWGAVQFFQRLARETEVPAAPARGAARGTRRTTPRGRGTRTTRPRAA